MSQDRRNYRPAAKDKNMRNQRNYSEYVYGNAVRKPAPAKPVKPVKEAPAKRIDPIVRKNREKARRMSLGYVLFLAAAMATAGFVLINYIQLQGELTKLTKSVAEKEVELNNLRLTNDEEYNRILSSIDLENIKKIAIDELGMIYAQEGQIVPYTNEKNDYMRKVAGNE